MTTEPQESIPISLVNHTVFCPRRAWLEFSGEKVVSYSIESGHAAHARVDKASTSRSAEVHSRPLRSAKYGVHGKADIVRSDAAGVHLVEYKATPLRKGGGVTEANQVQLALQKLCLEEEGEEVLSAAVWFTDRNQRETVELGQDVVDSAVQYLEQTKALTLSPNAPRPFRDDPRCQKCSHRDICLPDEFWAKIQDKRVHASDPNGQVLHLMEQGTRVSVKSGRVVVTKDDEKLSSVPLARVGSVVVHGNIDISSALLRQLFWRGVTTVWCSMSGKVYGWASSTESPNGLARSRQALLPEHESLAIARAMIEAKTSNQATFLRRNGKVDVSHEYGLIRSAEKAIAEARSRQELFGHEGEAAIAYFSRFGDILSDSALSHYGFDWQGRVGRGADDPINILLNYSYALLTAECIRALVSCGLDPHIGVLHSSNRNKPALALDLMEEFRPVVADSVVVGMINRREFPLSGFERAGGALRLSKNGRRSIVTAFEKKAQTEFTHPRFGYKVSWRRAIEVQARMLLGCYDGTQHEYVGIVTR